MGNNGSKSESAPAPEKAQEEAGQKQVIAISTEITRRAKDTTAARTEDGGLAIEYVMLAEGEYQVHRYVCGEEGKKRIMAAATGGLALPGEMPVPAGASGKGPQQ
jgi:hypothetical protein